MSIANISGIVLPTHGFYALCYKLQLLFHKNFKCLYLRPSLSAEKLHAEKGSSNPAPITFDCFFSSKAKIAYLTEDNNVTVTADPSVADDSSTKSSSSNRLIAKSEGSESAGNINVLSNPFDLLYDEFHLKTKNASTFIRKFNLTGKNIFLVSICSVNSNTPIKSLRQKNRFCGFLRFSRQ
ncbi:hypothetical protein L596_002647 [Steinernema carpocapsae]|uniref:Uncharacterized protein n=1 Tax=Steinernema carpocapsae TaxID=34508 RepID=A0A4U8UQ77_STECR|nr:hypothetical protein L596_002647 [Steinernema carpocapsae]